MAQGAMRRTRWMGKAQYAVKVFVLCSQFKTVAREKALQQIFIFVITAYLHAWYNASLPVNDLAFIMSFSFSVK